MKQAIFSLPANGNFTLQPVFSVSLGATVVSSFVKQNDGCVRKEKRAKRKEREMRIVLK